MRSYERAAAYLPNVVYLGGVSPDAMWNIEQPWFNENSAYTRRHPYGEIMPEDEFIGVMKLSDDFDLAWICYLLGCDGIELLRGLVT